MTGDLRKRSTQWATDAHDTDPGADASPEGLWNDSREAQLMHQFGACGVLVRLHVGVIGELRQQSFAFGAHPIGHVDAHGMAEGAPNRCESDGRVALEASTISSPR